MSNHSTIVTTLRQFAQSKRAGYLLINGPPQSGKSTLLRELCMPTKWQGVQVNPLGPVSVSAKDFGQVATFVLEECLRQAFISELPLGTPTSSLADSWEYVARNLHGKYTFVLLVNLVGNQYGDAAPLANLFAQIRALEGEWAYANCRLLHVVVGCWSDPAIRRYCDEKQVSVPYTLAHNLHSWEGISVADMQQLIPSEAPQMYSGLWGVVLHELTGGHPGFAKAIVAELTSTVPSVEDMLLATKKAAHDSEVVQMTVRLWKDLPREALQLVENLMVTRLVAAPGTSDAKALLLSTGIAEEVRVSNRTYLTFRSWFVELAIRYHTSILHVENVNALKMRIDEMVPEINSVNLEAYRLINDIENAARNFVISRLCDLQPSECSILTGRLRKWDPDTREVTDLQARVANLEQTRRTRGLPTHLNPAITFCTTKELADLVSEIGLEIVSSRWQDIGKHIREMAEIRNAVMHNQLIDFAQLQRLYELQAEIYKATDLR